MDLQEILKQFKTISPDASFTEKSKRAILATTPKEAWSPRRTIIGILESAIAFSLIGFFILILSGRFSGSSYLSPVQYSVINPQSLRAEAQAVDIQIQLANLTYQESTSSNESTPQVAAAIVAKQPALFLPVAASSTATSTGSGVNASSTSTSTITIDQALKALSE